MKHLDTLIEQYTSGMIACEDLETLVVKESIIAAAELMSPNSPEFLSLCERISNEYATYVVEKLGD